MSSCHICGKYFNRMSEHLRNFHKWTKEEVKKYRMSVKETDRSVEKEKRVAERRKIHHEELNEVRGELINCLSRARRSEASSGMTLERDCRDRIACS